MQEATTRQAQLQLIEALDLFRCYKNADIESFLRYRAIEFEKRGFCTVYLFLDKTAFQHGCISVKAYFTLSHKSIHIHPEVSKNVRGKIATHRSAELAHFVLIGQLGKYMSLGEKSEMPNSDISSKDILNDAFEVIHSSSELIVCRGVLVECSMEEKIHAVYENFGFSFLQLEGPHCQFYKRVTNNVPFQTAS